MTTWKIFTEQVYHHTWMTYAPDWANYLIPLKIFGPAGYHSYHGARQEPDQLFTLPEMKKPMTYSLRSLQKGRILKV